MLHKSFDVLLTVHISIFISVIDQPVLVGPLSPRHGADRGTASDKEGSCE